LDWLDMAMAIVENGAYRGIYQIASFHPDYCFADSCADDPANFTNRSPFPMLHILRESSLSRVLEHFPNPEQIPERNILKARNMGLDALQAILKKIKKLPKQLFEFTYTNKLGVNLALRLLLPHHLLFLGAQQASFQLRNLQDFLLVVVH